MLKAPGCGAQGPTKHMLFEETCLPHKLGAQLKKPLLASYPRSQTVPAVPAPEVWRWWLCGWYAPSLMVHNWSCTNWNSQTPRAAPTIRPDPPWQRHTGDTMGRESTASQPHSHPGILPQTEQHNAGPWVDCGYLWGRGHRIPGTCCKGKRGKWSRRDKGKSPLKEAWGDGELGMPQCGWVLLI